MQSVAHDPIHRILNNEDIFPTAFPQKVDDEIWEIQQRGKRVYAFTNVTQGIFSMLMQITLEIRSAQLLCALNHTQSSYAHTQIRIHLLNSTAIKTPSNYEPIYYYSLSDANTHGHQP